MTFRASARTAAAALLVGGLLIGDRDVYPWSVNPPTVPQETERSDAELFYRRLEAYTAVLNLVETGYAEPIDVNRAIARSIQRMLSRLDPHSSFYNPKTFRELRAIPGWQLFRNRCSGGPGGRTIDGALDNSRFTCLGVWNPTRGCHPLG